MKEIIENYNKRLISVLNNFPKDNIYKLAEELNIAWKNNRTVFLCGNGGSAGNAMHLANDFIYGAGVNYGKGLNIEALTSNSSVLTCLANDIGYENIFSQQLKAKGKKKDLLIVLSGSGNSKNVIKAIETAHELEIKTFAILGFKGGECKKIAQHPIHFPVDDMQISEDLQLIVGHMCMKWLCQLDQKDE